MKEIKAFIHRNRVADVVHALRAAGFNNISVVDVKGMLKALDSREEQYSIEIGEKVIAEAKLELVCAADQVDLAVEVIRKNARTGRRHAGSIYVTGIDAAFPIDG
ncbi:MAG: P-II family nitrogen regulator [Hyphomicrobium sp.]|uniref:P-II family nitrogen regulator n=1 Tax=Hyphomicrobium sp. TaxID=82 RepID=UPI00132C3618|nr:P-II family nitrogen regulator [Hyphomicrobium sp.]KAB2942304.1 MAG: P-II family nitrogen regulator [Hyphomicrobium sp.]MBZ0209253.1 P-II family nitrogen regulator [Hyphomicrobium sp.]